MVGALDGSTLNLEFAELNQCVCQLDDEITKLRFRQ